MRIRNHANPTLLAREKGENTLLIVTVTENKVLRFEDEE